MREGNATMKNKAPLHERSMDDIAEHMDMMDKYELFDKVFDQEGSIKPCGRDQCRTLIVLLDNRGKTHTPQR